MADIPTLAPAPDALAAQPAKKNARKFFLALLLIAAAGGGWFYLNGGMLEKPAKPTRPIGPPLYVALDPPFVVNFEAERLVRFLQITVQVMSRDPATIEIIKANDPVVRNDLLLLFANQKYASVATREGKEQLRAEALKAVKRVVAMAGGKPERVEAVYFTSFVMQ